jgi:DNA-binding transcriptional LysR family regulator
MDKPVNTFDWNHARAFQATAEAGSLSAAARALQSTQPTLGRQVAALEKELGVALFERLGNKLELTPTGLDLLEHIRAMGAAAARVSLTAAGQSESLNGNVCISASEVFAAHILPPIVVQIRQAHPGIDIEVVSSNSASDLKRREADIAIRNFRSTQPDLISKKIRDVSAQLYGTPAYLDSIGAPSEAAGFNEASFLSFDRAGKMIEALNALGFELTNANVHVISASHLVLWEMCKRGLGLCVMMDEVGGAEPAVRPALADLVKFPFPIWLTCHRELKTSRRIRVVFDLLATALAES